MFKRFLWVGVLFLACGFLISPTEDADARPFLRRTRPILPPPILYTSPPTTWINTTPPIGLLPGSKVEEQPVRLPSSPSSPTVAIDSPPRDTVLEPVPGTGSLLPIGPKIPKDITHTLSPETLKQLEGVCKKLADSLPQKLQVSMSPQIAPEISARLSRLLNVLEWLLPLGVGVASIFMGGQLSPLVARLVAGLRSIIPARSSASTATLEERLSTVLKELQEAKAAGPSSTPKQGS